MHPTPITEAQLRSAAERAVAGGHALAAVLFGSRARGTAGPLSDWDVCLVTNEDPGDELARHRALAADDALWDDGRIETLWLPRARFDAGVSAGTLECAIAHEGRALAGDTMVATKARTVPFEAETVQRNLGRASEHLFIAIGAARRHASEKHESAKRQAAVTVVTASIAGAEALGRALCALTETPRPNSHMIGEFGELIAKRVEKPATPLERTLMATIAERVQQLNDTANAVRKIEYGTHPGEKPAKTVDRFVRALETDVWIRQGLIEGRGRWAGLKEHPRRAEILEELESSTAAQAVTNAREWAGRPVELASERLDRAVRAWLVEHQALRRAYLERTQHKAKARTE